jgi:hypothetical protein
MPRPSSTASWVAVTDSSNALLSSSKSNGSSGSALGQKYWLGSSTDPSSAIRV